MIIGASRGDPAPPWFLIVGGLTGLSAGFAALRTRRSIGQGGRIGPIIAMIMGVMFLIWGLVLAL